MTENESNPSEEASAASNDQPESPKDSATRYPGESIILYLPVSQLPPIHRVLSNPQSITLTGEQLVDYLVSRSIFPSSLASLPSVNSSTAIFSNSRRLFVCNEQ